jgi:stringent starvation protein B
MKETPMSKEAVILKLLEEGDTMLCLDTRCQGVRVPPQHANNPALRLILNVNFPRPIEVTEAGVSANLSFGGRRFACFIPMAALWAAFNPQTMQGMMWPDSMPPEVVKDLAAQQQAGKQATAAPARGATVPPERRAGPGQTAAEAEEGKPSPPRQRGHLRVIK